MPRHIISQIGSYFSRMFVRIIITLALWPLLTGCDSPAVRQEKALVAPAIKLKYATGFTISKQEDYYLIKIITPYKGATEPLQYVFYPRGSERPAVAADAYVAVPVQRIVCTSTTHIPLLDYLHESQALVGFPSLQYISSARMRQRIDSGLVAELGIDQSLNIEKLITLQPDVVMAYTMSSDMGQFALLSEADIPVIINAEYLEKHPLGRAEWLKLAGILFGKERLADSVFTAIEQAYLQTRALVLQDSVRPTVMSGIVYGDSWYLPGGRNYAARLLQDAGFRYLWQGDTTSAFLPLAFEAVYQRAGTADYWIGVGSFRTLQELQAADSRYALFKPFTTGQVYSYNKRMGPGGGSEFLELGYLRPDLILKDLVKIGHPALLPDHRLFFYFKLP